MPWTKEKPTVPGWYWVRGTPKALMGVDREMYCVFEWGDMVMANDNGHWWLLENVDCGEWDGPVRPAHDQDIERLKALITLRIEQDKAK